MKTAGQRLNGLRWRLTAMRRLWSAGAEPDMPFLAPEPFDAAPHGVLDTPEQNAQVEGEILDIRGWAMFPTAATARVEVRLGEELLGRARVGLERPDVEELTANPFARVAGFQLTFDLTKHRESPGDTFIRVSAISASGERLDLNPVTVTISDEESEYASSTDLPPLPLLTPKASGKTGRRVLVYTHQLNLGGAQLYLMDLLRELLRQKAIEPTVISALDGKLREDLEDLGVPVHIAGLVPMDDFSAHLGRLEELAAWAAGRNFELALVNTATGLALPGAELATRLGIPAAWAIHESFPLAILWGACDPQVRESGEAALADAALVLFEAEATRKMFEKRFGPGRGHVLPYGLDLKPIDEERANFDRAAARTAAGIPDDAEVVLCVGTIEPRKAQLPLAQAFDLIADRHPKAHLVFVGGDEKPYSVMLAEYIETTRSRERIELIPITPDVQRWYGMSDFLVCASDVESLPRTVLEAMAWETPVLATSVFGLPELIDDGKSGWLCEAGDIVLLAEGLDLILSTTKDEREQVAQSARALIEHRHSLPKYAKEISILLENAINDGGSPEPQRRITAR